jgi:hypothetical protein
MVVILLTTSLQVQPRHLLSPSIVPYDILLKPVFHYTLLPDPFVLCLFIVASLCLLWLAWRWSIRSCHHNARNIKCPFFYTLLPFICCTTFSFCRSKVLLYYLLLQSLLSANVFWRWWYIWASQSRHLPTGRLGGWLADWFDHWLFHWLNVWQTEFLFDWQICWRVKIWLTVWLSG